jgi:alpha-mannosidase
MRVGARTETVRDEAGAELTRAEATVTREVSPNEKGSGATIHVVSHTHWDREWYLPVARFRQQLVALVDDLIDDPPSRGSSFLLDGQMVVIEDYLAVRPERRDALALLLTSGALEAGPWYVLADELIPGGEALVRNLLAGRRVLTRFGAKAPPVLYCPDSFGHPAALPTLAAGFGLGLVVLSRGFGGARWPQADAVHWSAPSGESAVLYHLSKKGYDIGENLPADPAAARERWESFRADLLSRSKVGVALLPNGADHHARQRDLGAALASLAEAAAPHDAKGSSLGAFATEALARAQSAKLESVKGELRDSYGFMWTLQGTFATRAQQKRRNAQAERILTREAEPWAALAHKRGARSRSPIVHAAWTSVLLSHPHDTLCGCSTDEVARAMDVRLDEAIAQGEGIRGDSIFDLIGHDPDAAREHRADWKPMAVVRNAAARPRAGVAMVRLTSFVSDVKVGANASPGPVESAPPSTPALGGVEHMQVLSKSSAHERTEAPRHYPDDDVVQVTEVAAWVPEVPAYGVRCFPHQQRARKHEIPNPVRADGGEITNGRVSVRVGADGGVVVGDVATRRTLSGALVWESQTDQGDLYTQSLRGPKLAVKFRGAKVAAKGPLRAAIETRWSFGAGRERVDATVTLIVDADAAFVRASVRGTNDASDHRLQLGFRTDVAEARVVADAMFGPVSRKPIVVSPGDAAFERPPLTDPLHRYVSIYGRERGATLISDGLGEYEVTPDGTIFVTVVRSVSELSRNDMPERPGHAGWPTHTPEAQCHGPFSAELALMLHGADSSLTRDAIERATDDVLLPLTGASLRSALSLPAPVPGVGLEGTGLACSAIKESDEHDWLVLRCVNVTEESQRGAWTIPFPIQEARLARLDETPGEPLRPADGRVPFTAPPRGVVTILVR